MSSVVSTAVVITCTFFTINKDAVEYAFHKNDEKKVLSYIT